MVLNDITSASTLSGCFNDDKCWLGLNGLSMNPYKIEGVVISISARDNEPTA